MPRFAANISMLYADRPFVERFGAAARDGFEAVECLFPYAESAIELRRALDDAGLQQVLINTPAGDWSAGERGFAAVPGRESAFDEALAQAIEYARALACPRIHLMAGVPPPTASRAEVEAAYTGNLRRAARRLEPLGLIGLIEPINRRDVPGYPLNTQADGQRFVEAVGSPALRLQMDLYHCQIVEGDLATRVRRHLPSVGHMQIAGVPERHEPDHGELNYPYLFELIDALGYAGWIGCEYRPAGDTSEGLGWLRRWRSARG